MEIMTLNTCSLAEPEYEPKLAIFAGSLVQIKPDITALQKANQSRDALPAAPGWLQGSCYVPCHTIGLGTDSPCTPRAVTRAGNHAFNLALFLARAGVSYQWTRTLAKTGYGICDEGLAVLSRSPILGTSQLYIAGTQGYESWKTRKILGINTRAGYGDESFYSACMGWWNDSEEPFGGQWKRISRGLAPLSGKQLWLMGDFNSPAHVTGQGRDLVLALGWFDTYGLIVSRDSGIAVTNATDGWREQGEISGMRVDYTWIDRRVPVISIKTIYDGIYDPLVSDHLGTITKYQTGQCLQKIGSIQKWSEKTVSYYSSPALPPDMESIAFQRRPTNSWTV